MNLSKIVTGKGSRISENDQTIEQKNLMVYIIQEYHLKNINFKDSLFYKILKFMFVILRS